MSAFLDKDVDEILRTLTREQKVLFCNGDGPWSTTKVTGTIDIPSVQMCDGPHGLRVGGALGKLLPATAFPPACASACTFNPDLLERVGEALGTELQASGRSLLLGPGVNIKRSPLCGRNFEYFSEDPYLAAKMGAAMVKGIQSQGVGACVKHYCANNQEFERFSGNSVVDERTLREIYMAPFEMIVKESQPWSIMCSYNRVNGIYASQHKELMENILRKEWGFKGFVVSDWSAVASRPESMIGGIDLQMPGCKPDAYHALQELEAGRLPEEAVDKCARRMIEFVKKAVKGKRQNVTYDIHDHHKIAKMVADEAIVLLKNDDGVLPLKADKKILFVIDKQNAITEGGGSSWVLPTVSNSISDFCEGYSTEFVDFRTRDVPNLIERAAKCDVVVVCMGQSYRDAEGYDRLCGMELSNYVNQFISQMVKVQENIVVVLHNGAPVMMPWLDQVKGVVEAYYGGQAVYESIADVLFGRVNPSGRLAETFPMRVEDTPSYLSFGSCGDVIYHEGIFVGYRYYDKKNIKVLFPFGYGLSYTTFEYSNLVLSKTEARDDEEIIVSVTVKNTGTCAGKEVVQLYVADATEYIMRPVKELKAFAKVSLEPNEEKTVNLRLNRRSFAFWNIHTHDWYAPSGTYNIMICKNVNEVILSAPLELTSSIPDRTPIELHTSMRHIDINPITAKIFRSHKIIFDLGMYDRPVRLLIDKWGRDKLLKIIAECNEALSK